MADLLALDAAHADTLLTPGTQHSLGVARTRGDVHAHTGDVVAWVLVEDGEGELRIGGDAVDVRGRRDVFEAAGWSALVGPDTELALDGDIAATIVWRDSERVVTSRLIDPSTVPDEDRGEGATARRVRTYVAEGPLIVGETLNPSGRRSTRRAGGRAGRRTATSTRKSTCTASRPRTGSACTSASRTGLIDL